MTMLQSMLRMGGVLVSVLLIILLGNPSAGGGQLPQQMMNAFWRAVNLVMPNPAAIKAVRDYESFGGHAAGTPLLTMALWAAVPIVVMMLLSFRNPGPQPDDGSDLAEASGAALAAGGAT
jgi:H+/gluconate symporter-like permease